jgi:hypothetical protein
MGLVGDQGMVQRGAHRRQRNDARPVGLPSEYARIMARGKREEITVE